MTNAQQDRYTLQRRLGGGGMGEVWLANDTLLNRSVAIKYLKGAHDPLYEELFLTEARTLASLNHPNITLIYDAVLDKQQAGYSLVMEYVEGKSLADLITNWSGPLPLEIILDLTIGVLQALQYAHGKGIVHRDIKPANVMMASEGVKLTDFGVAGLMSLLAQGSDYIVGTPAYMSPEQIDGVGVDGRADLYSLGIMLFELISGGRLPFEYSRETDIFTAHLKQPPPPLRDLVPHTLPALEHIIMRLLAKEPAQRYPSAAALLEVIKSIQARQKYSQDHLHWLEAETKPFAGRAGEIERLETVWAEVQKSAQPRLVVVKGLAGIGKSRLIVEFLGRAIVDKGFVVLAGKSAESGVPYSPYAEILATALNKGLVKSVTDEQINRLIDQVPGLARLLNIPYESPAKEAPALASPPTGAGLWQALTNRVTDTIPTMPAQTQWQFFGTVLAILTELGPTVLFLEDAASLDEASLALTRFLIRQEQLPLLLLTACRETEQAIAWLDSFSADEIVTLTLAPLTKPAVKECATHLLGGTVSEAVVNVLAERSQGHPLHLEEITPQMVETKEIYQEAGEWRYSSKKLKAPSDAFLPKAVFDAFTRQIESLSESHREALALAALLEPGEGFNFDSWLTLLGGEAQTEMAREALAEAIKKRLVRQAGEGRYMFRSLDISRALESNLPDLRRRELHRQAAEIMSRQQADPLLIGHHYERAGLTAEAAHYLEMAGTTAMAANAVDAAVDYYRRAAALIESGSAYQALGHLYRQTGKRIEAVQAFQRALELVESADDVPAKARILNGLSYTFWLYDYYKEAYQHAAAVLKLSPLLPPLERATAQAHLTMILWLLGRLTEAENWGQKAVQTALKSDDEAMLAEAYYRLGLVYTSQGKLADAPIVLQRSLELRRKLQDALGEADCLKELGRVALERGDFEAALAFLKPAQQLFEQMRQQSGLIAVYAYRGRVALYQDHPDETLAIMNKALPPAMELGQRSVHLLSGIYLLIAQASLAVDKLNRAKAAADNGLKLVEAVGNREYIARGQATLAQIYAAQDNLTTAEELYQKALTLFEETGSRPGLLRTQLTYAQFLAKQGQTDQATALEQTVRAEAGRMGVYLRSS